MRKSLRHDVFWGVCGGQGEDRSGRRAAAGPVPARRAGFGPFACVWIGVGLLGAVTGCRSEPAGSVQEPAPAARGEAVASMELTSSAFADGQPIPARYTEDGDDVSPPLAWSDVPEGTRELALICDDPDAPSPSRPAATPWVHWVLYKIPPETRSLPEGIPRRPRPAAPAGAVQGRNSFRRDNVGYRGPAPPKGSGKHRYNFKLYALDAELPLGPEEDKAALTQAMSGHVIGKGELMGTYQR